MKMTVWKVGNDFLFTDPSVGGMGRTQNDFVGYIDLPIEKPKKMVTKEAKIEILGVSENYLCTNLYVPRTAKNMKCIYEIDE